MDEDGVFTIWTSINYLYLDMFEYDIVSLLDGFSLKIYEMSDFETKKKNDLNVLLMWFWRIEVK